MSTILEMQHIEKSFPGVKALVDANLNLEKGEVHAFLGENGAGKSTLMKILVGILKKDAGKIIYKGNEVNFNNSKEAEKAGISIIYQEFNLIPKLSVAENVFLGRQNVKMGFIDWKSMKEEASNILKDFGVNISPDTPVEQLGVALQQMVEITKALSTKADILIMDEPTAALTDKEIDQLFVTIEKLKSRGVSIIYISHRLEEIYRIGDRATIMRDGMYIDTVQIKDTDISQIIKLMVGREMNDIYPRVEHTRADEVLRVENLNRGKKVKNVSFSAYKGEILGFAGLMGAGRTETMRAIFGADVADSGKIYIEGKQVNIKSPRDAINSGIGLLTEDRKNQGLILGMSIKENISLIDLKRITNKYGLLDLKDERIQTEKLSDDLTVKTPSVEQLAKFLSGGNQQKVVLAKWMNRHSKVLIFDEPTRGIDVGAKAEIYKLMNKMVDQGISIIMISSDLMEILGMSDRIYVMHEGEISGELSIKEASQDVILKYATGMHS